MDSQLIGASKPPLNKNSKKLNNSGERPLISRYSIMKSNHQQLNTILNDTQNKIISNKNIKVLNDKLNKASKRQHRINNDDKSKSSFDIIHANNEKNVALMEYSDFMKRAGMDNFDYFKYLHSAEIDRK